MCGPSLTEKSLCGARLYTTAYGWLPLVGRMQVVCSSGAHQVQGLLSAIRRTYCFSRMFRVVTISTYAVCGPGQLSQYSDSLRAGRSGDRIPAEARLFAPIRTGHGAHPASYTMGTESFPEIKRPRHGRERFPWCPWSGQLGQVILGQVRLVRLVQVRLGWLGQVRLGQVSAVVK